MNSDSASHARIRHGWSRSALFLAIIVALLGFYGSGASSYFSWESLQQRRDTWRAIVEMHRPEAALLFVFVSASLMSVSLPVGSILSIAAGALFDLWLGVALIVVASLIGATVAFLTSRYVLRDFVRSWLRRWFIVVDRGIERDGARYLLLLRLSPVVPFFAVNAVMGLTQMPLRPYLLTTLIGILPSCFIYVLVGTQIRRIRTPEDIVSSELIFLLTLLAFAPLLLQGVTRSVMRHRDPPGYQVPVGRPEEKPK